ncbi:SRPBCC family protein [Chengkuizengella axinellae]|uniref:SRPBCC domain-containing protein n=1 Tax=Chengkuizengella axinellae TaxID=3064388 RepID=A0ABT9J660_9BACL|nr:SRPBCC domain-containing protein [Chengkuizengella sp. 2205SS18-9]MDP5277038.1 SRPBCC domain-containing protein [Chengkuizengella sp. 2205SS18-9]
MSITQEIYIQSDLDLVWRAWTKSERITKWFAPAAEIELEKNGKFELYFDPSNKNSMSTIGCKIIKYEEPHLLEIQWKGPDEFAEFMNGQEQLTTVKIELVSKDGGTNVTLEHSGWLDTDDWQSAKMWHVKAWEQALSSLKSNMESGEGILCCK